MSGNLLAQYRFKNLGISDGLSQNSVHCIFQDSEGFIWLGTQDGLNRYDAYSFTTYRHSKNDTASLSDNFVTCIEEDNFHCLWIGTRNGMNRYNEKTEKFEEIFPQAMDRTYFHNSVTKIWKNSNGEICFEARGNIFIATITSAGYHIVSTKTFASKTLAGEGNRIYFIDSTGLYVTERENSSGKYFTDAKKIFSDTVFDHISPNTTLYCDSKGRLWFSTGNFVNVIDPKKNVMNRIRLLNENGIYFCEDNDGNTWIGGENGISVISPDMKLSGSVSKNGNQAGSISSTNILGIYKDHNGLMWVGTSEGGVNVCDPTHRVFLSAGTDLLSEKGVSDNGTWAVFQDGDTLLVGTSSGLDIFQLKNNSFSGGNSFGDNIVSRNVISKDESGNEIKNVIAITEDDAGNYWFGTRNNGLFVLHDGKITSHFTKQNSGLCSNTVFHLLKASDGSIWISTMAGLSHYDVHTNLFTDFRVEDKKGLPGNYVISCFEDSKKRIFIATTNGLCIFDPAVSPLYSYASEYNDKNSLSYNIVTSVSEDSHHRIWVSTLGGGIDLFDEQHKSFRSWDKENGLANNVVYGMEEDAAGKLWMFTNSGISQFDPDAEKFTNYYTSDGIIANEFAQNGFFKNASGEILLASPEGVMVFDPKNISAVKKLPEVALTSYAVNYEKRIPGEIDSINGISLDWKQRTVSFEFAALDFLASDRIGYSYKLEGFDKDWVIADPGQRVASYTSLPYGDYVFEVRVCNNDKIWSAVKLRVPVHVIAPLWNKKWFIALEAILILFLIVLVVRYYSQRKLRKRLAEIEVQRKIQNERERISRDLHDNVGSHLTYIIQSLDNISFRRSKDGKEIPALKIDELGDFTRGTMRQLRQTIWAINKETITLYELQEKISEHVSLYSNANEKLAIRVNLEGDGNFILPPAKAITIFRVIQEAVNNAVKHSEATEITVTLGQSGKNIRVTIQDNGKGFDTASTFEGHYGLVNMKTRVNESGGAYNVNSEKGKGTTILFVVPV
ncbi:MAG: hypothetical protein HY064_15890 [Bacteroidetes bacterium]|nr:hypothetical protein [Bacteroidota bacterium]